MPNVAPLETLRRVRVLQTISEIHQIASQNVLATLNVPAISLALICTAKILVQELVAKTLSAELLAILRCVSVCKDMKAIHSANAISNKWSNMSNQLRVFQALVVSMPFVRNRMVLVLVNVCQNILEIPTKDVDPNVY